jgi:hypothetical protein
MLANGSGLLSSTCAESLCWISQTNGSRFAAPGRATRRTTTRYFPLMSMLLLMSPRRTMLFYCATIYGPKCFTERNRRHPGTEERCDLAPLRSRLSHFSQMFSPDCGAPKVWRRIGVTVRRT